jgi:hypothetical protein
MFALLGPPRSTETAPMPSVYAISRMQHEHGAWYWAVAFRRRGKPYFKSFYDLRRGGSKKALSAAIAWHDKQLAKVEVLSKRQYHQLKRSSNSSGEVGVLFLRSRLQPQGMWQARLKLPNGKQPTRSFAVRKFGYEEAFRRAVAARQQLLELVADGAYLQSPVARQFEAQKRSPRVNGSRR